MILFFILFSQIEKSSNYSTSFKDIGLVTPSDYAKKIKSIKKELNLNKNNYIYIEKNFFTKENFDLFDNCLDNKKTIIAFKKNSNSQLLSLLKNIRNSFAHGNFFLKGNTFVLWTISPNKNLLLLIVMSQQKFNILMKQLKCNKSSMEHLL